MRLKNILMVVDDIGKSKSFYKDLFGLNVITDLGGNVILTEGLVLQERKSWEELIGKDTTYGGHDAELYFVENDMDSFIRKLESIDYPIEYVNRENRDNVEKCTSGNDCENNGKRRVIRIYDPDKHVIEIGEALK